MRLAVYSVPVVIGVVELTSTGCLAASCNPSACHPNGGPCGPNFCRPNG